MPCGNEMDWSSLVFVAMFLGLVIFSTHFPDSLSNKSEPENPVNAQRRKAFEALDQRLGQIQWKYKKQLEAEEVLRLTFRTLKAAVLGSKGYCSCPEYGPEWFEGEWKETIASWDFQATAIESCLAHVKAFDTAKRSF